jgi:hypothetical protein
VDGTDAEFAVGGGEGAVGGVVVGVLVDLDASGGTGVEEGAYVVRVADAGFQLGLDHGSLLFG